MGILISWLLQKPANLILHHFPKEGIEFWKGYAHSALIMKIEYALNLFCETMAIRNSLPYSESFVQCRAFGVGEKLLCKSFKLLCSHFTLQSLAFLDSSLAVNPASEEPR